MTAELVPEPADEVPGTAPPPAAKVPARVPPSRSGKGADHLPDRTLRTIDSRTYRYARSRGLDHATARDVAQQACVAVWRKRPVLEDRDALSYGLAVARNEIANCYRARAREITVEDVPTQRNALFLDDAELKVIQTEEARAAVGLLDELLGEREREVYVMREVWMLKHKEIAGLLGLAEGTVRATFHTASRKIERHLRSRTSR